MNDDVAAISKKINDIYNFPTVLKQVDVFFLSYGNKSIKLESFKKSFMLLLKMSLVLKLKVNNANSNIFDDNDGK